MVFNTTRNTWSKLINAISKITGDNSVVIGGDLNAQCSQWDSGLNNSSGSRLAQELIDSDFIVINDGSHILARMGNNASVPVLTLVSSSKCVWRTTDENFSSDHRLISFAVGDNEFEGLGK